MFYLSLFTAKLISGIPKSSTVQKSLIDTTIVIFFLKGVGPLNLFSSRFYLPLSITKLKPNLKKFAGLGPSRFLLKATVVATKDITHKH